MFEGERGSGKRILGSGVGSLWKGQEGRLLEQFAIETFACLSEHTGTLAV